MSDDDLRDDFGEQLAQALLTRSRRSSSTEAAPVFVVPTRVPQARARRRVLSTALAAAMVVSGIAVVTLRNHGPTHLRVATAPTNPAPTIPSSFRPRSAGVADWTWVSAEQGWALVRKSCAPSVCMSLRRTVDGGRTWTSVRVPEVLDTNAQYYAGATCADHLCVSGVRFATSKIGWLFGPAFLQTTDGGRTWTQPAAPAVSDVEASDGVALRLTTTDDAGCGGTCRYQVERKALGTGAWKRVTMPVTGSASVIILGSDAYVVSTPPSAGTGTTELLRSTDAGQTWRPMADPCPDDLRVPRTASASVAPAGVFVVLCSSGAPDSTSVRVSTDGGNTFGAPHAVPIGATGVVRAASAQTLAAGAGANGQDAVLVSHDGGITWATTLRSPPDARSVTFGWENDKTTRASFDTDAIWTTRDAGLEWTRNPVRP